MPRSPEQEAELKLACEVVERFARELGEEVEIVLRGGEVQVARLEWSGCVVAPTLYEAVGGAVSEKDEIE